MTPVVRDLLRELALAHPDKIFFADSRARVQHFRNVIVKPNQQEGEAACRSLFGRVDYPALRRHMEAGLLMVTHSGEGVLVVDGGGEHWVRTRPMASPVDICGAGDSFSAGAALALAAGATAVEAAQFGKLGGLHHHHENRNRHRIPRGGCHRMQVLAIDIGGTKFTLAAFDGGRMVRSESRPTDKEGGRDWMLAQIAGMVAEWRHEFRFERCGIGFGGPVNFAGQRVALSTHVGGWRDFHLSAHLAGLLGVPVVMDNDANVGALGEGSLRRRPRILAALLHDPLHGHRRRHL